MNYLISLLLALLILFVLNGCSTTNTQVVTGASGKGDKNKNWAIRQKKLSSSFHWQLQARASVAYRDDNWPFGIDWLQQSANQYTMLIKHPLTKNELAKIVKTAGSVRMNSHGRLYQDTSAEKLIENHLHVKLPVKGMQYWVRGIASPNYPVATVTLDAYGRPVNMQQAGWDIRYSKYNANRLDALPTLIKISRSKPQPVQVKMRIRQWK